MRKNFFVIGISLLLLFGCSKTPSDATIRQLLVGTWRFDQNPAATVQNKPDGTFIVQFPMGRTNAVLKGTWQVKSGCLTTITTSAPPGVQRQKAESAKVLMIDRHALSIQGTEDRRTSTARRQ